MSSLFAEREPPRSLSIRLFPDILMIELVLIVGVLNLALGFGVYVYLQRQWSPASVRPATWAAAPKKAPASGAEHADPAEHAEPPADGEPENDLADAEEIPAE